MDCELDAALLAFKSARHPGIYKADYIEELYRLFEPDEKPMAAPEMPDWCIGQSTLENKNYLWEFSFFIDIDLSLKFTRI